MISFKTFIVEITRNRYTKTNFQGNFSPEANKDFFDDMKKHPKDFKEIGEFTHQHTGNKIKVIDSPGYTAQELNLVNHKNELVARLPYIQSGGQKQFHAAYVRVDHQGQGLLKDAYAHLSSKFNLAVHHSTSVSAGAEKAIDRIGIQHDDIKNGLWFNIRKSLGAKDERDNLTEINWKIPPAPGTAPIPDDHVRLYHQTPVQNLNPIRKQGILFDKAQGLEGPKAIYADPKGFYGPPALHRPTVEFSVPKDRFRNPFVQGDVKPSEIIATHKDWHHRARYMENDPEVLKAVLSGKHDDILKDNHPEAESYKKAIRFLKHKYGTKE